MFATPAMRMHDGIRFYGHVYPEHPGKIFWTMAEPKKNK